MSINKKQYSIVERKYQGNLDPPHHSPPMLYPTFHNRPNVVLHTLLIVYLYVSAVLKLFRCVVYLPPQDKHR
jgi:hypothetical protein